MNKQLTDNFLSQFVSWTFALPLTAESLFLYTVLLRLHKLKVTAVPFFIFLFSAYSISRDLLIVARDLCCILQSALWNQQSPFTFVPSALCLFYSRCTTSPLLSFGSNQVDFGGIILSASATAINCSIVVGNSQMLKARQGESRRYQPRWFGITKNISQIPLSMGALFFLSEGEIY